MADRSGTDFIGGMISGMQKAKAASRAGAELMVFDWDTCARYIVEHKPANVEAGLTGDWDYTGGDIWHDGKPVPADDTYVYLASMHAIPKMIADEKDVPCWLPQSKAPAWNSGTYWPETAVQILREAGLIQGEKK